MPTSTLHGIPRLTALTEQLVMRPGAWPWPQALTDAGIVYGPERPSLNGLKPLINIHKRPKPSPRNEVTVSIERLHDALDRTLRDIIKDTKPFVFDLDHLRPGLAQRLRHYGDASIRSIATGRVEGLDESSPELREIALDLTLAGSMHRFTTSAFSNLNYSVNSERSVGSFLIGTLFRCLKGAGSAESAMSAFMRSAEYFSKVESYTMAAIAAEMAIMSGLAAGRRQEELKEQGKTAAKHWHSSAARNQDTPEFHDLCVYQGLVVALGTGAWEMAAWLFNRSVPVTAPNLERGAAKIRAAWASAKAFGVYDVRQELNTTYSHLDSALYHWKNIEEPKRPDTFIDLQNLKRFSKRLLNKELRKAHTASG